MLKSINNQTSSIHTGNFRVSFLRMICFCMLLFPCYGITSGQSGIKITKPELSLVNDSLIIDYRFTGNQQQDKFKVWIEITDAAGRRIIPKTLSGDIGDTISGNKPKQITWDIGADGIRQETDISVAVLAESIKTQAEFSIEKQQKANAEISHDPALSETRDHDISREALASEAKDLRKNLLYSMLLPGWGLSRMGDNSAFLLIGAAGIGCIGASFYLDNRARYNYTNYRETAETDKIDKYFTTGRNQYYTSRVLAYSAIAIWVADLGIVYFKSLEMKKQHSGKSPTTFSIRPSFGEFAKAPLICCFYNF